VIERAATGHLESLEIRRGRVAQPSIPDAYILRPGVGYIELSEGFNYTTAAEFDTAMRELKRQGMRALILDLRDNPGGLLTAATDVCDKFLAAGKIVSTRPDHKTPLAGETISAKADPNDVTDLPMVVLVNRRSGSGSEIVTGALQDHHRALILGERTAGIASVQMLFPLGQDKAGRHTAYLKMTTYLCYLPLGNCLQREESSQDWGVTPDVTIEPMPVEARSNVAVPGVGSTADDFPTAAALLVLQLQR